MDGIGNDWWGQVEVGLSDMTLLQGSTQVLALQPLFSKTGEVSKTAEGSISFSLKADGHNRSGKQRGTIGSKIMVSRGTGTAVPLSKRIEYTGTN